MDQIKTGNFLVSLRKEKNITQQQLADILQVSVKAVSKWECGEGYPSIQSLKDLSDFYGVTVDEIINGERNKTEAKEPVNTSIQIKEKKPLNFPILRSISLGITGLGIMLFFHHNLLCLFNSRWFNLHTFHNLNRISFKLNRIEAL